MLEDTKYTSPIVQFQSAITYARETWDIKCPRQKLIKKKLQIISHCCYQNHVPSVCFTVTAEIYIYTDFQICVKVSLIAYTKKIIV